MAPTFLQVALGLFAVFAVFSAVRAETHTVTFNNQCGSGTPTLILGGQIVSTGAAYTADGVINGIAYLQNGDCGFNGENCPLLEMNLANPQCPGCGSSTDISLIPPHAFTTPVSFAYTNGCDGQGAYCGSATCDTAFFQPNDNQVQVQCEVDNVNLLITFCGDATQAAQTTPAPSTSTAAAPPPTSQAAPPPVTSSAAPPPPASSSAAPATVVNVGVAPPASSAVPSAPASASSAAAPSSSAAAPSSSAAAPSSSAAAPVSSAVASASSAVASPSVQPGRCNTSRKRSTLEKKAEVPHRRAAHRRAH